ncbi:MAG TPA: hypothetical protein DCL54_00250 [Alphaproteobacteria bacterium]|nr:hypothetical protein [Alphaproteobacteria bacterium]
MAQKPNDLRTYAVLGIMGLGVLIGAVSLFSTDSSGRATTCTAEQLSRMEAASPGFGAKCLADIKADGGTGASSSTRYMSCSAAEVKCCREKPFGGKTCYVIGELPYNPSTP